MGFHSFDLSTFGLFGLTGKTSLLSVQRFIKASLSRHFCLVISLLSGLEHQANAVLSQMSYKRRTALILLSPDLARDSLLTSVQLSSTQVLVKASLSQNRWGLLKRISTSVQ
jgi:hypothetical protein